jgi:hypothetical protein
VKRALFALGLVACGTPKTKPNGVTRNDAVVVLKSNVRDAQLFVDGRFIAPLNAIGGGVAVEPGMHRFELRHEDYFSSYLELTVARAEHKKVSLDMAPVLP